MFFFLALRMFKCTYVSGCVVRVTCQLSIVAYLCTLFSGRSLGLGKGWHFLLWFQQTACKKNLIFLLLLSVIFAIPSPSPQPPSHWGYWVFSWKIFAIYEFFLSLYQWIQNLGWTNIFGITLHLHSNVQHWMRNRCAIIFFRFLSKIKLSFNKYSTKFLR